jgi:signal transduction histidine kinase
MCSATTIAVKVASPASATLARERFESFIVILQRVGTLSRLGPAGRGSIGRETDPVGRSSKVDLLPETSRDRLGDDARRSGSRYGPQMNTVAVSLPQRLRLPRRALLLPIVLAGLVQVDIWGGRFALGHMVGPRPLFSLVFAVTALSLIWCRRAPLAVLAFIVTADSAAYLVFGAPEGLGSFLPVLFAFYAVGRYSEPGNLVFAAPLTFAGIAIHELTDPVFSFGGSDAVFYAVLAAAWPLGYAFRRRAMEREELFAVQEQTARAAVTVERARIARELHDVVGHGLSVIVLQLVATLSQLDDAEENPLRERLVGIERSARDSLAEMRRLLDLIDDGAAATLAPQPGLAQLDRLVEDTRAAGGEVKISIRGARGTVPAGSISLPSAFCKRRSPMSSSTRGRRKRACPLPTAERRWSWRCSTQALTR